MEPLKWKARLAVIWLIQSINLTAYLVFSVILKAAAVIQAQPVEEVKGAVSLAGLIIFIFLLAAWLSLTLKDTAIRWINLVLAIFFAITRTLAGIAAFLDGAPSTILLTIVLGFVMALLTIWYAWKWPKQEA
jgi:hypothetical protein